MVDLHIHTINSDGDFSTIEILKEAELKGIKYIAFADHNNINAYSDLENIDVPSIYKGTIVIAAELEFCYQGRLFDMLAYGPDLEILKQSELIQKGMVHSTIEGETIILNRLKEICDKLGIKYTKDLCINNAYNMANDVLLDDILQYPENKEILTRMNILDRSTFYRKHFCEPTSPFYIDKTQNAFSLEYVCNLIHEAGGKAFFAHPFVYHLDNIVEIMDMLRERNLIDGIECAHRKHSPEQIEFLINYCDKYKLLKSGGSDKHTASHNLGYANNGKYQIQNSLVESWINGIRTYNISSHEIETLKK